MTIPVFDEYIGLAGKPLPAIIIEGDRDRRGAFFFLPAAKMDASFFNFMLNECRGMVYVALSPEKAMKLGLNVVGESRQSRYETAFMETVDAAEGIEDGGTVSDRVKTIFAISGKESHSGLLKKPGHIATVRAKAGGVLKRAGFAEAGIDLAVLAGFEACAVLCEILDSSGETPDFEYVNTFARKNGFPVITIEEIIAKRLERSMFVERVADAKLPTDYGIFTIVGFRNQLDGKEHVALVKGDIGGGEPVLVRVHSECLTGDAFGSRKCECGNQLHAALSKIDEAGKGVLVYLRQEGRGIGLLNKIRAYHLQDKGMDTVDANVALGFPPDLRDYGIGAQMLHLLGVRKMLLMTNNPQKIVSLSGYGIEVTERISLITGINESNINYMKTKQARMDHMLGPIVNDSFE